MNSILDLIEGYRVLEEFVCYAIPNNEPFEMPPAKKESNRETDLSEREGEIFRQMWSELQKGGESQRGLMEIFIARWCQLKVATGLIENDDLEMAIQSATSQFAEAAAPPTNQPTLNKSSSELV